MVPPEFDSGDTVVELAALANSAAISSGAVVGAWLTALAKRSGPASTVGFFLGAAVGFAVGQMISSLFYRSRGNTLIVKAGAESLHATIPAGLFASVLAALAVWLLGWFILGAKFQPLSFIEIALACGVVIGVGIGCLGSLV